MTDKEDAVMWRSNSGETATKVDKRDTLIALHENRREFDRLSAAVREAERVRDEKPIQHGERRARSTDDVVYGTAYLIDWVCGWWL